MEGIARLAEVARAIDAPVMADAWKCPRWIEIIEKSAAQIVDLYDLAGRLCSAPWRSPRARGGLVCNVNGSVETGIGNRANIVLASVAPAVTLSCVVPVSTPAEAQSGQVAGIYYKDDLIAAPMHFADGVIEVPTGAGMGIAVDEAKVRKYAVRTE